MANEENKSKKTSEFFHKVGDISKKAAVEVSKSAKALYEKGKEDSESRKIKRQEDSYNKRMRKYKPLSEEKFNSESFNLPNIIEIVDEAGRRDIDVCIDTNAIGWVDKVNDTEILHIYDEFAHICGIQFVPGIECNEVYCVDLHNRKRFLNVKCIFNKVNEEKVAELERVANYLGAKMCTIEIVENVREQEVSRVGAKLSGPNKESAGITNNSGSFSRTSQSSKKTSFFEGSSSPRRPELKWFAHDDNINGLIEMRCSGNNSVKSTVLSLKGSTSATMNQKVAATVDKIMKVGASMSAEKQASKEYNSTLIFEVEF